MTEEVGDKKNERKKAIKPSPGGKEGLYRISGRPRIRYSIGTIFPGYRGGKRTRGGDGSGTADQRKSCGEGEEKLRLTGKLKKVPVQEACRRRSFFISGSGGRKKTTRKKAVWGKRRTRALEVSYSTGKVNRCLVERRTTRRGGSLGKGE